MLCPHRQHQSFLFFFPVVSIYWRPEICHAFPGERVSHDTQVTSYVLFSTEGGVFFACPCPARVQRFALSRARYSPSSTLWCIWLEPVPGTVLSGSMEMTDFLGRDFFVFIQGSYSFSNPRVESLCVFIKVLVNTCFDMAVCCQQSPDVCSQE